MNAAWAEHLKQEGKASFPSTESNKIHL